MGLFGLTLASAAAGPLTFSTSGTFSASTPASLYFQPNAAWSFSLTVASNPVVISSFPNVDTELTISNVMYSLNGSPVSVPGFRLFLYPLGSTTSGMFDVCMEGGCNYQISATGPQLYSGTEVSPTVLSGLFAETQLFVFTSQGSFTQQPSNVSIAGGASAAAEPASGVTSGIGLVGLFLTAVRISRLGLT
jgi:hypothetical protein